MLPLAAVVMPIVLVAAVSVPARATPSVRSAVDSSMTRAQVETSPQLPSQALYSWGSNDWGQLALGSSGQGTPTGVALPSQVAETPDVSFRSVAAGGAFTLGLTVNGQVYAWGTNATGTLGTGSPDDASSPQPVSVPGAVVAIAAGSSHSLALTAGGQLFAWGANLFGQLGNGTTTGSDVPVPVTMPGGVSFSAIAAGGDHSLAVSSAGQVYAWGANFDGQLGTGNTSPSPVPVAVPGPPGTTFTSVAAGTSHSLALTLSGQVYAWGLNASGQLGDGTMVDSPSMVAVSMPAGAVVSSIATGAAHSLALTSGGQVFVWGSNVFGQLDSALVDTLPVDSDVPVQPLGLPPLTTFVSIAGALNSSYAITSAGVPWVWGGDAYGQLGDGSPGLNAVPPESMSTLPPGTLATGMFAGPDASAAFLVTRADQSVTFPALPSPTYGDPPVDIAPSTSSGLSLDNTASGACTGPLVRLYLADAGTCTLTASQTGNFWYYPVTATATFTVAPAPLAVVPDNATGTAGVPPPALGYQLVGFRNGDSPAVVAGTAWCSTTATAASYRGTYPIGCSSGTLAAANYYFVSGGTAVLTLLAPASGYAVVGADGSIWALGPAPFTSPVLSTYFGSMGGHHLNAPVVGAAFTPLHDGYWLVATDGGIFSFGAATFLGSMGGTRLNKPVVGMTTTADGRGYWEVASDGGIFTFGDAPFLGSMGGTRLNKPVVGMAATPDGRGYWLVASDGGIFCFGDATYYGSTGGAAINSVVGMATTPDGRGYWLTTSSGAVFTFGGAKFEGSLRYINLNAPVVGITPTNDGNGYWLAAADGGVFTFGDAAFFGTATRPPVPIDGII
jgi:alpha-tubulin suppressor-like RCC1 family protein